MELLHGQRKTVKENRAKSLRQNENPIKRGMSRLRTNENSPRQLSRTLPERNKLLPNDKQKD